MNITYIKNQQNNKDWYLIDAEGKTLGRMSTHIAYLLQGKHNYMYTPYFDSGNHIIVINTEKISISGNKKSDKIYYSHSGRPGSLKTERFEQLQHRLPNRIIEKAVKNMLPKGTLGRKLLKNLKTYPNHIHPHSAQNPKKINIE
jgi:large subunit ribosomal protein L13